MKCSLCYNEGAIRFLNLGQQPLANKYPTKEQLGAEDFFPLEVFFCTKCKNVQLGTVISRSRMFEDYYYLSSVNPGLVRHFEEFAKQLAGAKFVVDIGSNDGILLKPFRAMGVKAIGVEPSINVSKIANDQGLTTVVSFFDGKAVGEITKHWGKPDVVIASSVFTHLENPHQCIEDVKKLMTDEGKFIIEVEYIANILKDIQFERFYLDRIFYYSLTSLINLFASHDMIVTAVERIEPHGGSLRVVAQNKKINPKQSLEVGLIAEEESGILNEADLKKFALTVDKYTSAFRNKLEEYKQSGFKVAGYGAPARVATICNYGKIDTSLIEFIIDDSSLKQNRFSPGTHIPIFSNEYLKDHKPDVFVVFAYEYFNDIKKKTGSGYRYLIPIPPREVV